jgi:hypothetical protein
LSNAPSSNIVGYWLTDALKSPEQIDQWLADRGWTGDRLRLAARSKNDGPLVTQIIAEARSQGCTETTLDRVLATASQASAPVNLDWIPGWCQTPSATAARDLGRRAAMHAPAVAVVFFERALAMPFTHEDVWRETRVLSMAPIRSDAEWERRFRAQTRVALAQAYRATGNPTRAATVLNQLSSEDRSMVAPTELADAAGLDQSRSGARPAEGAVPPTTPPKPDRTEAGRDRVAGERVRLRQQFQADIRSGDWRSAEAVWTALLRVESPPLEASHDLSSAAYLLAQLADAAAQHGDAADALRFWRRLANVDRTVGLNRLEGFPLTRLRSELTIFYEAMAERDPASWVPAAALEKLRRR